MKRLCLLLLLALAAFSALAQRTPLTASTRDFYVAMSGSDTNDCRLATPCRTIQRAVDNIKQNYDSNCVQPWIHISAGTYAGWEDYGPQVGCQPKGGGPLVIAGMMGSFGTDCTDQGAVNINGAPGVNAISLDGGAIQTIICMTINATGAAAVYATNGAIAEIGLLRLGTANAHIMADAGGSIFVTSTLNAIQGANYGLWANLGGLIYLVPGVTVTFSPGIGFAQQYVFASNGGKVVFPLLTINIGGTATGQKCYATMLGIVNTDGQAVHLPGSSPCGANAGGVVH